MTIVFFGVCRYHRIYVHITSQTILRQWERIPFTRSCRLLQPARRTRPSRAEHASAPRRFLRQSALSRQESRFGTRRPNPNGTRKAAAESRYCLGPGGSAMWPPCMSHADSHGACAHLCAGRRIRCRPAVGGGHVPGAPGHAPAPTIRRSGADRPGMPTAPCHRAASAMSATFHDGRPMRRESATRQTSSCLPSKNAVSLAQNVAAEPATPPRSPSFLRTLPS